MLDREPMTVRDAVKYRLQDGLVEVFDALAPGAHEVVVVFGLARDVRRDVAAAFETASHATFDLRLKRPVHGRQRQAGVARPKLLVELLR